MSLTKALTALRAAIAPKDGKAHGTARHGNRQLRYYDPGSAPMPRDPRKLAAKPKARKQRSGKRTAADQKRIAKAEAKRQRKAARRLAA